jgi:hypothetical protein
MIRHWSRYLRFSKMQNVKDNLNYNLVVKQSFNSRIITHHSEQQLGILSEMVSIWQVITSTNRLMATASDDSLQQLIHRSTWPPKCLDCGFIHQ